MEIHARHSALAKRLWKIMRITFYMMRKGLVSKRKLIMDINLMMNKRSKLLRKSFTNLLHHHHNHRRSSSRHRHVDYEFSCSNSPNPVFFRAANHRRKHYFPCINSPDAEETEFLDLDSQNAVVLGMKTPEYVKSGTRSPYPVIVSDYLSEEEAEGGSGAVDEEAEEFIRRFYEQLRAQGRVQLLQYQESECQEMLARGS